MREFFEYPPTRSNRAKWALEELGLAYTSRIVDLTQRAHHAPTYKEIHPLGAVPAYRTADYSIVESVAIALQIIDENPTSGLAPAIGTPERAAYYQWSVFASSELDPALSDVMLHSMHLPAESRVAEIEKRGRERFADRAEMLCHSLENRDYLLGESFTGADIMIGYCCNWAAYIGMIEDYPRLVDYYARLQERPAFNRVFTK
jgi:glutathione S-transferase